MDFGAMTTDDLLAALPLDKEDNRWELKSASLLEPVHRSEFKKELGKQVSAFANSGGGYLIFGISKLGQIEPCESSVGRTSMKDYLATMVEQSVEYPIRDFEVHRIPFTADASQSIFAVVIQDSHAAPHQAKEERQYYYRIDGHSKPAPHFHIELLRNRLTKAVVEIKNINYTIQDPGSGARYRLNVRLDVMIENTSLQAATHCGIHAHCETDDDRWEVGHQKLCEGVSVHAEKQPLLPIERANVVLHVSALASSSIRPAIALSKLLSELTVWFRPLSQNYVGEERSLTFRDPTIQTAVQKIMLQLVEDK